MADIPKLKKKISAFLASEEGKISKESLIKTGAIIGAFALSSALVANNAAAEATHVNTLAELQYSEGSASATHTHHGSHSSHASY